MTVKTFSGSTSIKVGAGIKLATPGSVVWTGYRLCYVARFWEPLDIAIYTEYITGFP